MRVVLLKHNQEAFQEINEMIASGIKKIAAPRATGSGKTYLMGALAEQYNNDKKLVLEPTRPLLNSIEEKFNEFGIANTDFITYQKLIRMSDEDIAKMDYKLIFLDECHHGTSPVWGQKVNYLINTHSDSIIFGTSATTVRNDGVNVVETLFDNNAIGELPLSTAIARKVLPCPHYITAIYRLDDEFEKLKKRIESATNSKSEKKEFYKKMKTMKLHFEKSYGVPLILNKYIKVKNGKYLVFCKDKKHLDAMRDVVIDWFKTAGIKDVHASQNAVAKLDAETQAFNRNTSAAIANAVAKAEESGVSEAEIQGVFDKYTEVWNSAMNNYSLDFDGFMSGGKSAAKKAGGEQADAYIKAFEKEYSHLKDMLNRGEISEAQYLSRLRALYTKYFKDRKKYLDEYKKYESEYLTGMLDLHNKALSGISTLLNRRISAANDSKSAAIDAISEEKEARLDAKSFKFNSTQY